MDKYQVRSTINETFPIGYDPMTGNISIDTTGANDGDVLSYSSGTVGWFPGGGDFWALLGNAGTDPTVNFLGTTDNQDLVIRTNNTEWVRILATGEVGINTPSPVAKLDIRGEDNPLTLALNVQQELSSGDAYYMAMGEGGSDFHVQISDSIGGQSYLGMSKAGSTTITNTNQISLSITGGTNACLKSAGLGIGTTTPDEKLHVVGSVKIVDGTEGDGKLFISDANGVGSWISSGGVVTGYVPYTGATADVDLDTYMLNAKALHVKGTGGAGHLGLKHQSADATASANETALYADSNGDLKYKNDGNYRTTLKTSLNTADRIYTFQDASGTLAFTSDLPTPAALTKTDDTNVTLTLGGTPATALLQAASITVGWSGQLAITRGGTGLGTLGTALQQLRVNAGGTALEYFTPSASGLTVGTTPITSGTAGRILFEGAGNVLQENAILNLDTTNGLIIGGTTARGTRQTIVNSANTYATKVFVQRNAADSADYTSIRGDGTIDFANLGTSNTFNTLITGGGSALVSIFGTVALQNTLFGAGNSVSYTAGTVGYNFIIGNANIITSTSGTTQINQVLGFNNTIQNSNYCTINGFYTRMNGATRSAILGGRGTSIKEITGSDVTILGTATTPDALSYNSSTVTYYNNDNPSHWLYKNGNMGLFGQKYYILQDNTGAAAYRLSTYMSITATNTLTIHNGTATAVNIVDAVQIYAADITAGNTATFIRNENGDIVKLYAIGGWGTPTGTLTRTTFDTTTVTLSELAERVAALISDLKTGQQLLKA